MKIKLTVLLHFNIFNPRNLQLFADEAYDRKVHWTVDWATLPLGQRDYLDQVKKETKMVFELLGEKADCHYLAKHFDPNREILSEYIFS